MCVLVKKKQDKNIEESNESCQLAFLLVFHGKHLKMFVIQL